MKAKTGSARGAAPSKAEGHAAQVGVVTVDYRWHALQRTRQLGRWSGSGSCNSVRYVRVTQSARSRQLPTP